MKMREKLSARLKKGGTLKKERNNARRGGWEAKKYTVEGGEGRGRRNGRKEGSRKVKGHSHFLSITAKGHILGRGCVCMCVITRLTGLRKLCKVSVSVSSILSSTKNSLKSLCA